MMDALTALKTRRSVRQFAGKEVPEEHLREIVDCARLAATARNEQPWEFVVVRTPALRQEIARLADYGRFIADAPALAVFCKETKYYLKTGRRQRKTLLSPRMPWALPPAGWRGTKRSMPKPSGSCWVSLRATN